MLKKGDSYKKKRFKSRPKHNSLKFCKKQKHKDEGKPSKYPAVPTYDVQSANNLSNSFTRKLKYKCKSKENLNNDKYKSSKIHLEDEASGNFEEPFILPSMLSKQKVQDEQETSEVISSAELTLLHRHLSDDRKGRLQRIIEKYENCDRTDVVDMKTLRICTQKGTWKPLRSRDLNPAPCEYNEETSSLLKKFMKRLYASPAKGKGNIKSFERRMKDLNLSYNSYNPETTLFSKDVPQEKSFSSPLKNKSVLENPGTFSSSLYEHSPLASKISPNSDLDETLPCHSLRSSHLSSQQRCHKTKSDLKEMEQQKNLQVLPPSSVRTFSSKSGRRVSLLSVSVTSCKSVGDKMETHYDSDVSSCLENSSSSSIINCKSVEDKMETEYESDVSSYLENSNNSYVNKSGSNDVLKISKILKNYSKNKPTYPLISNNFSKGESDPTDSDTSSFLEDSNDPFVNKKMPNDVLKPSKKSFSSSENEPFIPNNVHQRKSDPTDSGTSSYLEDSNKSYHKSVPKEVLEISPKSKKSFRNMPTNPVITDNLHKKELDSIDCDKGRNLEISKSSYVNNKSGSNDVLKISKKSKSYSKNEPTYPIIPNNLHKRKSDPTDSDPSSCIEDSNKSYHKSLPKEVLKISPKSKKSSKNIPTYPVITDKLRKKELDSIDSEVSSYIKNSKSCYNHESIPNDKLKISLKSKCSSKNEPTYPFIPTDLSKKISDPTNSVKTVHSTLNHSESTYNYANMEYKTQHKFQSREVSENVPLDSILTMTHQKELPNFAEHKVRKKKVSNGTKSSLDNTNEIGIHNPIFSSTPKNHYSLKGKARNIVKSNESNCSFPSDVKTSSTDNNSLKVSQSTIIISNTSISHELGGLRKGTKAKKPKTNNFEKEALPATCLSKGQFQNNKKTGCNPLESKLQPLQSVKSKAAIPNADSIEAQNVSNHYNFSKAPLRACGERNFSFKKDSAPPLLSYVSGLSPSSSRSDSYVSDSLCVSLNNENSTNEDSHIKLSKDNAKQHKLKECCVRLQVEDLSKYNNQNVREGSNMPLISRECDEFSPKVLKSSNKSCPPIENHSTDSLAKYQTFISATNLISNNNCSLKNHLSKKKPCESDSSWDQQKKKRKISCSEFVEAQKSKGINSNKPTLQQLDGQPQQKAFSQKCILSEQGPFSKDNKGHKSINTPSDNHLKKFTPSRNSNDNLKSKLALPKRSKCCNLKEKLEELILDKEIRNTEKCEYADYGSDKTVHPKKFNSSTDKYKTLHEVPERSGKGSNKPKNRLLNISINKSTPCVLSSTPNKIVSKLINTKKMSYSLGNTKKYNKKGGIKKPYLENKSMDSDFRGASCYLTVDVLSSPIFNKLTYGF